MDTIQQLMSLAHDMSDAVHAMHGRGAVTHDADWLKARKALETALRELLGEPVAYRLRDPEASDFYKTDVFVYYSADETKLVVPKLEPLCAMRHNAEVTGLSGGLPGYRADLTGGK